ncbi:mitochondrial intermembrane space import and assembly protein 40-B [Neodiprion pinetum]|uniref:Mitochondrial intermembrane space import and assembly protein 40-B n=1 Tax=Neodiprion lecontei TaxID=441921 RepID=A0A6J0BVX8_NEOLC|nr:mitochondrial intermembrane space import and assembly protein 40-B [Neodiprion lecontei]XP_046434714.1 mitochondrial intermembrane space import and assembly protein 40-B [Neodiprion fabricii]XP_046434715.1 mitochondrial intermembrane space import and assembly protein 40-B [Neodiprion fabricii]XP_046434716.1 mitochondrial intermembrane space import and assembly protein 40-B [Neodiprion fabricii]XP_046491282.1 mitochondrial intermembrane space import and assembly protein 40-B [Neodiprion pinet
MSIVRKEGKDTIIFASKEDHASPSKVNLPEPEPSPGLILANGEINWNCPCLGGMATGPCGLEFREAFSCFHYSAAEPKGSDCYDAFKTMQTCMSEYPALYGNKEADLDDLGQAESQAVVSKDSEDPIKDSRESKSDENGIEASSGSKNEMQHSVGSK